MRRLITSAFLVLLAINPPTAAAADRALVAIEGASPDAVARLLADGVTVVRDLDRYLLAVATPEEMTRISGLGLHAVVLDPSTEGKTYYTAAALRGAQISDLDPRIRVLRVDGAEVVFEATPEVAETAAGLGFELARVFMRPIRLPRSAGVLREGLEKVAEGADPIIQALVDSVSSARIDAHVQRLQAFKSRHSAHDSALAAAEYLRSQFLSYGIDSVTFHTWDAYYAPNVVAVLPGRGNARKVVIVGGHYDSVTGSFNNAPGADDDASGTALVLEGARVLASHPFGFDYTLTFIGFSGEEQGLLGSEAYAADAATRHDDIVGMVEADMVGYLAPGDVMNLDVVDNYYSTWMRDLVMSARATYVPGFAAVDGAIPRGASSDHASFWANGFDALLFFEDTDQYSPYIHSTSDVVGVSYNSPALAAGSTKTAVALLAEMARPLKIAIEHTPLPNTTDTQNPYRVVARVTAAGALNADSLLVRYAAGLASGTVPLAPTGNPDEYEALIPPQPGGTFVAYHIVAEDADANRWTDPWNAPEAEHRFFVGTITPLLADDFEADRGWTVGDAGDNATGGIWLRANPVGSWSGSVLIQPEDDHTGTPGTLCFVTGNADPGAQQGANDVDGGKTTLLSPAYDVSTAPTAWVRYYRWYTNDTRGNPNTDTLVVDVSADAGANWVRLETDSTSDRSWRLVEKDLADFVPLTSQVRFRFVARDDDPLTSIVEAAVDDFSLVSYQSPLTGVAADAGAGGGRLVLAPNVPNPFNPKTTIRFAVPKPGPVRLAVYDVSGREVAELARGQRGAGWATLVWNGRDGSGREVGSGPYLLRLEAGREVVTRKIVLLK